MTDTNDTRAHPEDETLEYMLRMGTFLGEAGRRIFGHSMISHASGMQSSDAVQCVQGVLREELDYMPDDLRQIAELKAALSAALTGPDEVFDPVRQGLTMLFLDPLRFLEWLKQSFPYHGIQHPATEQTPLPSDFPPAHQTAPRGPGHDVDDAVREHLNERS